MQTGRSSKTHRDDVQRDMKSFGFSGTDKQMEKIDNKSDQVNLECCLLEFANGSSGIFKITLCSCRDQNSNWMEKIQAVGSIAYQ